jgi:N-acetylglutamate synthase-like GNAT family acetyltransferase
MEHVTIATLNPHGLMSSDIDDINALFTELSPGSPPLKEEQLYKIAKHHNLYVARQNGYAVVAMTTFAVWYRKNGQVGLVENFVVKPSLRRQGIGTKLMMKIASNARFLQIDALELVTDRESDAVHFYRALKFAERDASYFTLKLKD